MPYENFTFNSGALSDSRAFLDRLLGDNPESCNLALVLTGAREEERGLLIEYELQTIKRGKRRGAYSVLISVVNGYQRCTLVSWE